MALGLSFFPGGRRKQLRRIRYFETLLDELQQALSSPTVSKEELLALRGKAEALERYYVGDDWKRDYADDEAGRLPGDLKRGVLSEDGIFNTLEAYRERLQEKPADSPV